MCYCCCSLATPIAYCTTHDNRTYWMYPHPTRRPTFGDEDDGGGGDGGDGGSEAWREVVDR